MTSRLPRQALRKRFATSSLLLQSSGRAKTPTIPLPHLHFCFTTAVMGRRSVPYHILAGAHLTTAQADSSTLEKIARVFWQGYSGALSFLMEDKHDLVVGMRSMATVRNGGDFGGRIDTDIVSCDHFNYLSEQSSRGNVQKWLSS